MLVRVSPHSSRREIQLKKITQNLRAMRPLMFELFVNLTLIVLVLCEQEHDFFTSGSDMEILLNAEKKLAKKLLSYVEAEEGRLDEFETEIRKIENVRPKNDHKIKWISHATNSYVELKKMIEFWPKVVGRFSKTNTTKERMLRLFGDLNRLKKAFPDDKDMRGALAAIFRLQDTYNISTKEFTYGLNKYSHKLTVEEIFEMGFLCVGLKDFYHGKLWFDEALQRFPKGLEQFGFLDRVSLIEYLAWSEYHLGNLEQAINLTEQIVKVDPNHRSAGINLELYKKDLHKSLTDPSVRKIFKRSKKSWENRHNMLCGGKEKMEQEILNKLYCKYSSHHPQFLLKPLKMEYAYFDPEIIIYHGLVQDYEINTIKNKARPLLNRATVHDPKTGKLIFADYRVSKSAWLAPEMDVVVHKLINRVGAASGLNMRYSENLQVANYGLAGQYEPHFDHSTIKTPKAFKTLGGNRIATMLMYMSEVERGGATVFVNTGPGVTLYPEKGAGIFWYNLKRNGNGNPKTRHAGCPVLVGHKWISNLWIHEHGQEFRRRCSLNPDE